MVQFKFIGRGQAKGCAKDWVDAKYRELPYTFSITNSNITLFSPSIIKRLQSIKKHGVIIPLRKGRGYFIGIQAINKAQHLSKKKSDAAKLRQLGKKIKLLQNKSDVKEFIETLSQAIGLSKNRNIIPENMNKLYGRMWMWYSSLRSY